MNRSHRRRLGLWIAFLLLWCFVLAAIFGLSRSLLRLADAERRARQTAAIEENLRLSLWRLDSVLAPLLAQQTFSGIDVGNEWIVPIASVPSTAEGSAPFTAIPTSFAFRFPFTPGLPPLLIEGQLAQSNPAETLPTQSGADQLAFSDSTQREIAPPKIDAEELRWSLTALRPTPTNATIANNPLPTRSTSTEQNSISQGSRSRAFNDLSQRSQNVSLNNAVVMNRGSSPIPGAQPEPLVPLWNQGNLLLARIPSLQPEIVEGWVIDWKELKNRMKESIRDLLPDADFLPTENGEKRSSPDALASLPCLLIPGQQAGDFSESVSDAGLSVPLVLTTVWLCVLSTAIATGWLMASVLRWSDRRESFVAAVTHELRTPLTSLQLYSEMLSSGMAQDESTRQSYLATLQKEVERIGHLVENVFAFARLERGGRPRHSDPMPFRSILDRIKGRLSDLADRNGMKLHVEPSDAWDAVVAIDVSMVEQILVNLVDNACKFAKGHGAPILRLEAHRSGLEIHVAVQDQGPGIPKPMRWWSPFFKSVEQAADTAPGIGLGLAISQRFARAMGGRLVIENTQPGARVTLVLPIESPH
jgi:signal transduction histidine kinase